MTNKTTDCNTCKESLEKCTCITVEHGPLKISFPYENSIPCDHTHWCAKCGEVFKVNNGWIKCTDKLPEGCSTHFLHSFECCTKIVLVCKKEKYFGNPYLSFIRIHHDGTRTWENEDFEIPESEITHWMALPEMPNE